MSEPAHAAALYFHPEGYTTSGPKLMGRHAAGESFLRGYLRHARGQTLWAQVERAEHAQVFEQAVQAQAPHKAVRAVTAAQLPALSAPGVVHHPGPGLGAHAWQRGLACGAQGHAAYSLCGVTHTTSSAGAMDAIVQLLTAPVQPWDGLICTSRAVRTHVERVLQAQADHLAQHLGATRVVLPRAEVIPLGIHTEDFAFTPAQRAAARTELGVDEHARVVLFMGRLSFHAKAHPLVMYRALQRAAEQTGRPVVLVECGWHANDYIRNAYAEAARAACPGVRVVTLDGRKPEARQTAWAGADLCCSLVDNIQETFGLVPLEAMAAGLPLVVSDWDGYRDTVRDGVEGFCVPTLMPQAGLGHDLALRHALELDTYDMHCGHVSSLVAVDEDATVQGMLRLFESPALCRQMGEAGRKRAREVYDWRVILPRYEALWQTLGEIRRAAPKTAPPAQPWPARMDPFHGFAAYPTHTLTPQTRLARVDESRDAALLRVQQALQLQMVRFAAAVLPTEDDVRHVVNAAQLDGRPALELVQGLPPARHAFVFRSLAWLVKLGVLKVCA